MFRKRKAIHYRAGRAATGSFWRGGVRPTLDKAWRIKPEPFTAESAWELAHWYEYLELMNYEIPT